MFTVVCCCSEFIFNGIAMSAKCRLILIKKKRKKENMKKKIKTSHLK